MARQRKEPTASAPAYVPRQATLAECNREHAANVARTKKEEQAARAALEKITKRAIDSLNSEVNNDGG